MPDDDPFDLFQTPDIPPPPPCVRLIIVPDIFDRDFTHFYTPKSLTDTFNGLPNGLRNKLRSVLNSLVQRNITRLDFDSSRPHTALVQTNESSWQPFDLRLLRENEDFEKLFAAVNWWIERAQRKIRCGHESNFKVPRQTHKTWTCECGEVVNVEKEYVDVCTNPDCPSWEKLAYCLGKSIGKTKTLKLA